MEEVSIQGSQNADMISMGELEGETVLYMFQIRLL